MKVKKIFSSLILLLLAVAVCSTLFACEKKNLSFNDLEITVSDLDDIAAGTHTLRYFIENEEEYKNQFGLRVIFAVEDEDGSYLDVSGSKVTLESNKVYTVTVVAENAEGTSRKQATYTVTTKKTKVTLTFAPPEGTEYFKNFKIEVYYGQALTELPEVPDAEKEADKTYTYELFTKKWSKEDFSCITEDETVTAVYTYKSTYIKYTATFDSHGAGEIAPIEFIYNSRLALPEPAISGMVFAGWHFDEEHTRIATTDTYFGASTTLHAKWTVDNGVEKSYFDFAACTGGYMISAVKSGAALPEVLHLPNSYNGKAVAQIGERVFANRSDVKKVYIPDGVYKVGDGLFQNNTAIEEVVFESTALGYFSADMFNGATALKSITAPTSVTGVGIRGFLGCTALTLFETTYGSLIKEIGDDAFSGCTALAKVVLYHEYIFYDGESLDIGDRAFLNCYMLTDFVCNTVMPPVFDGFGRVFNGLYDGTEMLLRGLKILAPPDWIWYYVSCYNLPEYGLLADRIFAHYPYSTVTVSLDGEEKSLINDCKEYFDIGELLYYELFLDDGKEGQSVCSDAVVAAKKVENGLWMELDCDWGEYTRLFFVLDAQESGETEITVYCSSKENGSYDGGSTLIYKYDGTELSALATSLFAD